MPLPMTAFACHGLAFARFATADSWIRVAFVEAGAGVAPLVRADPSARTNASLAGALAVRVDNLAAADGDPIYFTFKNPGDGAVDLGIRVEPGAFFVVGLTGSAAPAEVWVRGSATTPLAQVTISLGDSL